MTHWDGPELTGIYLTEDGVWGQTTEVLQEVYDLMLQSHTGHALVRNALQRVIQGDATPEQMLGRGEHLMAVSQEGFMDVHAPLEGVMYTRGRGRLPTGAYAAVQVGLWLKNQDPVMTPHEQAQPGLSPEARYNAVKESIVSTALRDVEIDGLKHITEVGKVPVSRETSLQPLMHRSNEARFLADFATYGHWQDVRAVQRLGVPLNLRGLLETVVNEAHSRRTDQSFDELVAELQERVQKPVPLDDQE